MNITIDFEGAIARALAPEALNPILDKHLKEAISSAIRDATGYSSEFQKTLKEQLATAMPHGLHLDDVAKFQHVLNAAMVRVVQSSNESAVNLALEKAIQAVMPDVPAVMKMSELLVQARAGFHKEQNEAFYAYFQPNSYSNGGGWLYLDANEKPGDTSFSPTRKDREARKYSAKHRLAITSDGDVYALKLDGKDLTPASRPDVVGLFDSLLMAMYVGRTKLEIDMDDDDVRAASCEQYN